MERNFKLHHVSEAIAMILFPSHLHNPGLSSWLLLRHNLLLTGLQTTSSFHYKPSFLFLSLSNSTHVSKSYYVSLFFALLKYSPSLICILLSHCIQRAYTFIERALETLAFTGLTVLHNPSHKVQQRTNEKFK